MIKKIIRSFSLLEYSVSSIRIASLLLTSILKKREHEDHFIILFSLGRSGSSMAAEKLSSARKANNLNEFFHFKFFPKYFFAKALSFYSQRNGAVLIKILTYQILRNKITFDYIDKHFLSNSYEVIILNRDPFEQCLSVCYSKITDKWHKNKASSFEEIIIPEDVFRKQMLRAKKQYQIQKEFIAYLKKNNKDYSEISYEEISNENIRTNNFHIINKGGVIKRIKNLESLSKIFYG